MPCMHRFMFWFPVRLGSVIVGVATLLQDAAVLVVCGVQRGDSRAMSESLEDWLQSHGSNAMAGLVSALNDNPEKFLNFFLAIFTVHGVSCTLLIVGALKLKLWLVYPFAALEGGRLAALTAAFTAAMLLARDNISSLGAITVSTVGGTFALLLLFYMWFCTISLCQMVKAVKRMNYMTKQMVLRERMARNRSKYTATGDIGYFSNQLLVPTM
ncbi:uncharacterized protein LOC134532675 [Bacillus rossius redtenbacheri]|uniref:uncharacterized protein LOC134532675 n=1 Tax=Bacillus rossius redtenbacheri TaxID=93214 RepID=UPI002FDE670E